MPKAETPFIEQIEQLMEAIKKGKLREISFSGLDVIFLEQHIYKPLLALNHSEVKVTPVHLNRGEKDFVLDLRKHVERHAGGKQQLILGLLRIWTEKMTGEELQREGKAMLCVLRILIISNIFLNFALQIQPMGNIMM